MAKYNPLPKKSDAQDSDLLLQHEKELKWQSKILNWTFAFIIAILVVCVIGFLTFIYTYFQMSNSSSIDFKNTVEEFNSQRYQDLSDRVRRIEEKGNFPVPTQTIQLAK